MVSALQCIALTRRSEMRYSSYVTSIWERREAYKF